MGLETLFRDIDISRDVLLYEKLRGKTLFITGGTGFFGKWLLLSICKANDVLNANIKIHVLSRDPEKFLGSSPFFCERKELLWARGDILDFDLKMISADYVIHAATEASVKLNKENPKLMYDTCVCGAKKIADWVACEPSIKRILFTSSGAVYGVIPPGVLHVKESFLPDKIPSIEENAYMCGKIESENIFFNSISNVVIARCFAFSGPLLPLDGHFAFGNFIRDVLEGNSIQIQSDGSSLRSYLYASDLVTWLLTILLNGEERTSYNVGSENSVSIKELAQAISEIYPQISYSVLGKRNHSQAINTYVPDTTRARIELGLTERFSLKKAIELTVNYYKTRS